MFDVLFFTFPSAVFQLFTVQEDVFHCNLQCKSGVAFLTHWSSLFFQEVFMCESGVTYFETSHYKSTRCIVGWIHR